MPHEAYVRAQYDRIASAYDRRWNHYIRRTHDVLLPRILRYEAQDVLDVGCGTGTLEARLAALRPHWRLTGVDLSKNMIEEARRKLAGHENISFTEAAADRLPFLDAHFDLVVSASAFHYFPAPGDALREMRRVLRPAGALVLLDWCRDLFPMPLLDVVLHRFDPAHGHTYTKAELRRAFVETGFRVHRLTTHRRLLVWGLMLAEATPRNPPA